MVSKTLHSCLSVSFLNACVCMIICVWVGGGVYVGECFFFLFLCAIVSVSVHA